MSSLDGPFAGVVELRPEDAPHWAYVAEGAAHVVCTYVGPPPSDPTTDDRLHGYVLRLAKGAGAGGEALVAADAFRAAVIAPLLGGTYLGRTRVAAVPAEFVDAVAVAIEPCRPAHRKHTKLARSQGYALLLADATRLPGYSPASTVAVELKPKWGFLPTAPWVRSIKRTYCRFCMHRELKRAELPPDQFAATVAHERFCPLQLYAGNAAAAADALRALLERPGNNLRLFHGGERAFPLIDAEAGPQAPQPATCDRALQAAVRAAWSLAPDADALATLVGVVAAVVATEPLLPHLARLQHDLDALDVEGIHVVHQRAVQATPGGSLALEAVLAALAPLAPWTRDVVETRGARGGQPASLADVAAMPRDAQLAWLRRFLVAAALKDCSVFVAVAPASAADGADSTQAASGTIGRITVGGRPYAYRLQVVDVDPKDPARIAHYYTLDQAIATHAEGVRDRLRTPCNDHYR